MLSKVLAPAAVFSTLVPLILVLVASIADWEQILDTSRRDVLRQAKIAREHALKVIETAEIALDRVADHVEGKSWPEIMQSERGLHELLASLTDPLPQVSNAFFVDSQGVPQIAAAAYPTNHEYNVSDRDYFVEQRGAPRGVYVGRQILGRARGTVIFSVSRRLIGPDGKFNGVAFMGISQAYLNEYWATLAEYEGDAFGLVRSDGAILARMPPGPVGASFAPNSPILKAVSSGQFGVFDLPSPVDGETRMAAVLPLQSYPVVAAFGRSYSTLFAIWRQHALWYLAAGLVGALAIFASMDVLGRHARAERRALLELAAEEKRRRQAEASLTQSQKLDLLGQLTGGVAHDFNNLLSVMVGVISAMRGKLGDPRLERRLDLGMEAAERGSRLVQQLLTFARKKEVVPVAVELNAAIDQVAPLLRQALGGSCSLEAVTHPEPAWIMVDPTQFEMAVLNVAVNARHAMPHGGTFRIEVTVVQDEVRLVMSDAGVGMTPEVLNRVFEPFFTTRPEGEGTGLGMAMVFGFVKQAGGYVGVQSTPDVGTTITMTFPVTTARPEALPSAQIIPLNPSQPR